MDHGSVSFILPMKWRFLGDRGYPFSDAPIPGFKNPTRTVVGPTDVQKSFTKVDENVYSCLFSTSIHVYSICFFFKYVFRCFGAAGDDGSLAWVKTAMVCQLGLGWRLARGTCIRPRKWLTETAVRLEVQAWQRQRLEASENPYRIDLENGGFNDV